MSAEGNTPAITSYEALAKSFDHEMEIRLSHARDRIDAERYRKLRKLYTVEANMRTDDFDAEVDAL